MPHAHANHNRVRSIQVYWYRYRNTLQKKKTCCILEKNIVDREYNWYGRCKTYKSAAFSTNPLTCLTRSLMKKRASILER